MRGKSAVVAFCLTLCWHRPSGDPLVIRLQTILKVFLSEAEERDPRFDQFHYRFAVPENLSGVLVGRVELKPRKLRVNALMRYSIVNTEMRSLFNITSVTTETRDSFS